jgi:hypothetical protein
MQPMQWEVLVLKPTQQFLSFLEEQVPDAPLPEWRVLQTDNTAYVIPKHHDDEALLNDIENRFPDMFRYEIARWLGKAAYNSIQGTFLDFLCCFKFEIHSRLIIMEQSLDAGRQFIRIKPRSVLLKWMKSTMHTMNAETIEVLQRLDLSKLAENATLVIKNFSKISEIKSFIRSHYHALFESEMTRVCDNIDLWPTIDSYQMFSHYFAVEIHTQLVHL